MEAVAIKACRPEDVFTQFEGNPEYLAAIREYLSHFLRPAKKGENVACPACRRELGGLLGTFQWGIAHGEGNCGNCGWPVRMYHRIEKDGEELVHLTFPLAHRCYRDEGHTEEIDPAEGQEPDNA